MHPVVLTTVATLLMVAATARAEEPDLAAEVRAVLEPALRESSGVGFVEFGCDAEPPLTAGRRFRCDGVDTEGDRLTYVLEVDEEGQTTVVRASEPATALPAADLEALEAPCRAFLAAYQERRWSTLYGDLHPALQEAVGGTVQMVGMLEPIRSFLGGVISAEPSRHTVTLGHGQELGYDLVCANGRGEARFQLTPGDDGGWKLLAFLVTVPAGSHEQAVLVEREGRSKLSPVIGAEITGIEAPLRDLRVQGDEVEGVARLADGRAIRVGVEQHGSRDDFDPDDYRFFVLDVEFLVGRSFEARGTATESVVCGAASLEDGGRTTCTVVFAGGAAQSVVVRREGGTHRMAPAS